MRGADFARLLIRATKCGYRVIPRQGPGEAKRRQKIFGNAKSPQTCDDQGFGVNPTPALESRRVIFQKPVIDHFVVPTSPDFARASVAITALRSRRNLVRMSAFMSGPTPRGNHNE